MGARHADRLWMIGGVLAAALLVAAGWFVAISPKKGEVTSLKEQTSTTEIRLISLRHRLAELEEQASKLATYRAALKTNQAALPTDSGVPDFLRQLQRSGDKVDVTVSGVTVSAPQQDAALPAVYDLPITLTADGSPDNLGRFLDELQTVQPRAVLIESANLSSSAGARTSLSVTLKAFVASGGKATGAPGTTK
jgi:type IV pilus assembly protein PilO